jgi:hypothetical protein
MEHPTHNGRLAFLKADTHKTRYFRNVKGPPAPLSSQPKL